MANVAKTHLYDKDIKNLVPREKRYFKVVGYPKELCVFINPKGTKKFSLRLKQKGEVIWYELKEFREGIYSVAEARKEAYQAFIQIQQIHIRKFRKFAKKFKILQHKTSQIQYKFSQDLAFWNFYCLKNLGAVFCKRCEL